MPCLNNGVVEPIGQAIIAGFHIRPEEMVSMTEYAISEDQFHLAWRLNTAAREMTTSTDTKTAEAAVAVVASTDEYFRQYYAQLLHEDIEEGDDTAEGKPPGTEDSNG